jgi:hypothetical protein
MRQVKKRQVRAKRAAGRSLADFGALSEAEQTLLKNCAKGNSADIAETRPATQTPSNEVRASFVRFLVLGGDEQAPVHEHGVKLCGAWLTGVLDLDNAEVSRPLEIAHCRIERLDATGTKLNSLILHGSKLEQGIRSFNFRCTTSVYMCHGFQATDTVSLRGATIDGDLLCTEGEFAPQKGLALQWAGLVVGRTLTLPDGGRIKGGVDLTDARVTALCDSSSTWLGAHASIALDGFIYGRLSGDEALTEVNGRIRWLDSQLPAHLNRDFRRQPWEHLSSVLRVMGHPAAARKIAMTKQNRLRAARNIPFGGRTMHKLYGAIVGYGYAPARLFWILLAIWIGFGWAYSGGSPGKFVVAAPLGEIRATTHDSNAPAPAAFDPYHYSLDVLLPIDLDVQKLWKPNTRELRWLVTIETILGWLGTLLALAALGNLLKKD